MKFLRCFPVLFLVAGAASIYVVCSSKDSLVCLFPDITTTDLKHISDSAALTWPGNDMTPTAINNRKLMKDASNARSAYNGDGGKAYTDDYGPIDPVPNSKASVRPGPIQHGTPLMPYIPIPSPPPSSSAFFGIP
nr:Unconventional myosin-VIIb like [Ipomoea batatas]